MEEKEEKQQKQWKEEAPEETINETSEETVENETEQTSEITGEQKTEEQIEKIAKLEEQCADYLDKYQRCLAEFDNFRKRTTKEKASMYDDGVRSTIEK